MMLFSGLLGLTLLSTATAMHLPHEGLMKRQATENPYPVYTIDQPVNSMLFTIGLRSVTTADISSKIDHFTNSSRYEPHTDATFQQRYIFDHSFYRPGGPVFLYIGGETSLESRLENIQTGSTSSRTLAISIKLINNYSHSSPNGSHLGPRHHP